MGGGLMQLVAYGAQDIYLTGNPQITFFKVVYRRHTNFSMETIEQTINGSQIANDTNGTVTISRNGDLVYRVYVSSNDSTIIDGSALVKEAELEIGGQRIDKHTKEWNEVWNELSTSESKALGLKSMQSCIGTSNNTATKGEVKQVQVPLNFWFCRNPGLALPLIALQYHEVKIKFVWGSESGSTSAKCVVMADYIYLDTDERRRFAQVSHEYLIEQLQVQSGKATSGKVSEKLNFNHPVKELIWTLGSADRMDGVVLKLNGHERFSAQDDEYFTLRQPFDYHTAVPGQNLPTVNQVGHGPALLTNTKPIGGGPVNHDDAPDATTGGANLTATQLILALPKSTAGVNGGLDPDPDIENNSLLLIDLMNAGEEMATQYVVKVSSTDYVAAGNNNNDTLTITLTSLSGDINPSGTHDFVIVRRINSKLEARTSKLTKRIGVYSFALKPEEHQPSGTCNFSRIDNAQLTGTTIGQDTAINIYAVNYNVLRIMSGMGGLAYSN